MRRKSRPEEKAPPTDQTPSELKDFLLARTKRLDAEAKSRDAKSALRDQIRAVENQIEAVDESVATERRSEAEAYRAFLEKFITPQTIDFLAPFHTQKDCEDANRRNSYWEPDDGDQPACLRCFLQSQRASRFLGWPDYGDDVRIVVSIQKNQT
jgi:hypothetical protein